MKKNIYLLIRIFLVVVMLFVGIWFYKDLPNMIPTHWGIDGNINDYSQKNWFVFLMPVITLIMIVLFKVGQLMDPKKDKYETFKKEWEIIQTGIVAFMSYLYFITVYLSFNQTQRIEPLLFVGMGILFILIGNYMGKIRQNNTVGFRLLWTINNEEVWRKTNRLGGYMFVLLGIVFLVESYIVWNPAYVIISCLLFSTFIPTIYSYILYKKLKK